MKQVSAQLTELSGNVERKGQNPPLSRTGSVGGLWCFRWCGCRLDCE